MADDDANDSQTLTGGDITWYRAPVARISYLSQYRPDLKFASMHVCRAMAKPSVRDMERVKRSGDTLLASQERSVGSAGRRVASWKRIQTLTGEVTKPLGDRCRLESS